MKSKTRQGLLRFPLSLLHCGNHYYIDRVTALEKAVARKPRRLQIDLSGEGEIPADWALLIRSILRQRSPRTQVITNARSSLQNGSVLVWLLGDRRLIRDDARIFFRRADIAEDAIVTAEKASSTDDAKYVDSYSEADPDEADHAKVLQRINEYLPVKEFAGRVIEAPVLRQFALVENEKFDRFLASAFGLARGREQSAVRGRKSKPARTKPCATTEVQS